MVWSLGFKRSWLKVEGLELGVGVESLDFGIWSQRFRV